MLTGGTSLVYFTDMRWGLSERLFAMVLPGEGRRLLSCAPRSRKTGRASRSRPARSARRPTCGPGRSTRARTSAWRRACAIAASPPGTLGIEETVRFVFSDGVAKAAPTLTTVERHARHRRLPHVKDAHELELMRLASAGHAEGLRGGVEGAEGRHDAGRLRATSSRRRTSSSASRAAPGVQVGQYSALPHGSTHAAGHARGHASC